MSDDPLSDNAEEEEGPRIKVTDRRLFDSDGNLRDDVAEEQQRSPSPHTPKVEAERPDPGASAAPTSPEGDERGPVKPGEPSGPETGAGVEIPGAGPAEADDSVPGPGAGERPSAGDLPRDFPAFVESQYFEALLYLGAVPHPQTGERVQDLDFARYKIDLLGMIRDKTEGNLESEEEDFLDKVLADLRMRFTQAS